MNLFGPPYPLLHLATWSQLAPLAAAWPHGYRSRPHRWILAACFISFLADLLSFLLGREGINNHWVKYTFTPAYGAAFLLGLTGWQQTGIERLTVRFAVPTYVATWIVLVALTENLRGFSLYAGPMHALILLAVALWTLARRSLVPSLDPIWRCDWFWITGGIAIYAAGYAAFEPVSIVLLERRPDLVINALNLRAVLNTVAFLLIAGGMWWASPVRRSGRSSSPLRWA